MPHMTKTLERRGARVVDCLINANYEDFYLTQIDVDGRVFCQGLLQEKAFACACGVAKAHTGWSSGVSQDEVIIGVLRPRLQSTSSLCKT